MRELIKFDSDERLGLGIEDIALVSVSLKSGKTKQTKKEFVSSDEAKKACVKKERKSLEKGFVLQNLDTKRGKPCLHVYTSDKYLRASEFCLDAAAGKLVVIDQSRAYAVNLKSGDVMVEFRLDHVVKKCEAKFIDGKLAVRTDYGCFSLYEI
jgi:hypothetical protein